MGSTVWQRPLELVHQLLFLFIPPTQSIRESNRRVEFVILEKE
jgi:hypothetical protein